MSCLALPTLQPIIGFSMDQELNLPRGLIVIRVRAASGDQELRC